MVNSHFATKRRTWRIRAFRVFVFCCLLGLVNVHHWRSVRDNSAQSDWRSILPEIQQIHPAVVSSQPQFTVSESPTPDTATLLDADGNAIGTALLTSPSADHLIGFSGPTNLLLVFDAKDALLGSSILGSGDTQEHVQRVADDEQFFRQLVGQTPEQLARMKNVDSVTGATLTSLSILEAIRLRCFRIDAGNPDRSSLPAVASLRFPDPPQLDDVKKLYPQAASCERQAESVHSWVVKDSQGATLGYCLRLSPAADNHVGFQGPTDALVAFDAADQVTGIAIGVSFDNEPYVGYVKDDRGFKRLWNGKRLADLASEDASKVEGVSGATMTSQSVAQAVQITVQALLDERRKLTELRAGSSDVTSSKPSSPSDNRVSADGSESLSTAQRLLRASLQYRAISTGLIVLCGVILGLTHLRSRRWLRRSYQIIVIIWLGWMNADFLSQAQLVGWTQFGIPWERAMGQVLLTLAAIAVPVFRGQNLYCAHVCPHGALQQFVRNRLPWQLRLPVWLTRWMKLVPALLLFIVLAGAFGLISVRAVDLEPFDAWVWRIAGSAAIAIAVIGLLASLFVPMAYCRHGCPTGAILDWLSVRSDRWSLTDTISCIVLGLCAILVLS